MKVISCIVGNTILYYTAPDDVIPGQSVVVVETNMGYQVVGVNAEHFEIETTQVPPIVTVLDLDDYVGRKEASKLHAEVKVKIGSKVSEIMNSMTIAELRQRFPEIEDLVVELNSLPTEEDATNARLA